MARGRQRLVVAVTDARGRSVAGVGLARWLVAHAPASARGAVTIALVPDTTMRRLNRNYRGKDAATDVLSFPAGAPDMRRTPRLLGDIAIAEGVARRQARAAGHAVAIELRVLALHGLLHLLGYDHETDTGEMARIEDRLRRRSGLPGGLIARGRGGVRAR